MSSFNKNNGALDDLLLRTLMGRLHIRPSSNPFPSESLENLLFNASNVSDDDESADSRSLLAKEEARLEREIIRIIVSGRGHTLKANSGQAVAINDHHMCVGFHEDTDSDYRVWEWHGHIMIFDEENGYSPEYIYGNYFERLPLRIPDDRVEREEETVEEKVEEKVENQGLRELIDGGDSTRGRILHRNINAGAPRF